MNAFMDIVVVMVASRISHLARIWYLTSRLSSCLSRSPLFCTSASLSHHLIAAVTIFASSESSPPSLSSTAFRISIIFVWSNSKKGGVQGHRPANETSVLGARLSLLGASRDRAEILRSRSNRDESEQTINFRDENERCDLFLGLVSSRLGNLGHSVIYK
jgi:hypothetical protein